MKTNKPLQGLYGITDSHLFSNDESIMLRSVEAALRGGLNVLQYREKSLPFEQMVKQAVKLKRLCDDHGAVFIINDHVELALEVNASGVHLGQDDGAIEKARQKLGDHAVIGYSCYNQLQTAIDAEQAGADYVAFGRFFSSQTKPGDIYADHRLLQQARPVLNIPICVIGGISVDNVGGFAGHGVDLYAVIRDLFGASDIELRAKQFKQLISH